VADSERDGNDEQHRDPAGISFEYPEPRAEELVPGADRRTGRPDSGRQGFWPPGQIAGSDRRVHGGQAAIDVQRDAGDIGRVASAQERVSRRLVSLVVSDPEAYAWGGELLLRDGEPAGFASSAAFGHTVGRAVLLGYLERRDGGKADRDWLSLGRYQVAIGGERYDATVSLQPPYDPSGARIRA
jgi:hypothetical protein